MAHVIVKVGSLLLFGVVGIDMSQNGGHAGKSVGTGNVMGTLCHICSHGVTALITP